MRHFMRCQVYHWGFNEAQVLLSSSSCSEAQVLCLTVEDGQLDPLSRAVMGPGCTILACKRLVPGFLAPECYSTRSPKIQAAKFAQ